jgi:hypothetical protein
MPQQDLYHQVVKNALIKDGWTITDDPLRIEYKGTRVYADLGAEKVLAAERGPRKIVVEIKMFTSSSPLSELEKAIGQYGIYRTFLKRLSPERELFLAIAEDVFQDFLSKPAIQDVITDHEMRLLVFQPETEEVTQWIN